MEGDPDLQVNRPTNPLGSGSDVSHDEQHLSESLHQHSLKRAVYSALGVICVGLGAVGVVFPVLPTTPFILLAGLLFLRSSDRMHRWLRHHPRFSHVFEKKGLTKREKIVILIWVWVILLLGTIFTPVVWVKVLLPCIGLAKLYIFARVIRTIPPET
jgi:uncharacterized membrane protein YbaN (DUF454 family)